MTLVLALLVKTDMTSDHGLGLNESSLDVILNAQFLLRLHL